LRANSEHNCNKAGGVSLLSSNTEESRQANSRLVFAFFIAEEFAGQTESIPTLAGQVQKGPHDSRTLCQDLACNGANTDMVWQEWNEPWQHWDGIHVLWNNGLWDSLAEV